MKLRLLRYHTQDDNGWFFDIDFKNDTRSEGPGYFVQMNGEAGDLRHDSEAYQPMDSAWAAVVFCVVEEDSQAPRLPQHRVEL